MRETREEKSPIAYVYVVWVSGPHPKRKRNSQIEYRKQSTKAMYHGSLTIIK